MKKLCATCQAEYPPEVEACPADGGKLLAIEDEEEDPIIGMTVDGRYVVQSLLGQGGMGSVYRAHQKTMNRPVALKVLKRELSSDPQIVKRFLREVQAVSILRHPNTIIVFDFGQTPENLLYMAMEYLEGVTLSDRIKEAVFLAIPRALEIVSQVCGALTEAHDKGIVHRDLKPDNIFLANMGGKDVAKVLDFGIARLNTGDQQTQLTRAGLTVGTPPYMSPEQAEGSKNISPASDIYSLGCILYECLAGQPPFVGESPVKILMDHCTAEVPKLTTTNPNLQVSPTVEQTIMSMLSKDPMERPASAKVLQLHFDAIRAGQNPGPIQLGGNSVEFVSGDTAAWQSTGGPQALDPMAPTSAWDSNEVVSAVRAAGQHPFTDVAGEAIPASTGDAVAALRKNGFPTVAVATAVVLLGGALGGYFALQGKKDASSSETKPAVATAMPVKKAPVKPAEVEAAKPEKRSIWLRSTPASAFVVEGNKKLGQTPLRVDVIADTVRRMTVKLDGYKPIDVAVDPGMKDDLSISLIALPKIGPRPPRRPIRRRAKPKPKAADDDILVDDLK